MPSAGEEGKDSSSASSSLDILHVHDLNQFIFRRRLTVFFLLVVFFLSTSLAFYSGFEGKSELDAVYYAIITMSTVGYGDQKPETLEGRIFAIFFVLFGFSILAYGISLAATFALEKADTMKAKHENRVNRLVNKVADIRLSISSFRFRQKSPQEQQKQSSSQVETDTDGIQLRESRSSAGSDLDEENNAMLRDIESDSSHISSVRQLSEAYRKSYDYETWKMKRRCIRNFLFVSVFMLIGCLIMMAQEDWTFSDALYWAVVTITTVGYGDYTPATTGGKVFTILYVMVGCLSMASMWGEIIKYPLMIKYKQNELAVISQFDENMSVKSMDSIGQSRIFANFANMKKTASGEMSKIEFVLGMMELMGKVNINDVSLASSVFDRLDGNDDGIISSEEVAVLLSGSGSEASSSPLAASSTAY